MHKDDAEDAIDSLDGRTYDGRELRVQMAKYVDTDSPLAITQPYSLSSSWAALEV